MKKKYKNLKPYSRSLISYNNDIMYFTEKETFYINSNIALNGTSENFSYTFKFHKDVKYDKVVVLAASIPKTYYLIQDNNNTFTLNEGVFNTTITIPIGNYNVNSFKTTLTSLLNANTKISAIYSINNVNFSQTADTGKYTFLVTNNASIQPKFYFNTALYEVMGFNKNSSNTFVGNSLTSVNVVNFSKESTLFIHSNICKTYDNDILQVIFTSGEPTYSYITFENNSIEEYAQDFISGESNIFSFWITDEIGNIINLNGINVNIVLMVYKQNNINEIFKKYMALKLNI